VESLWRRLAAGNVTIVSTDHVSWSEDRKTDPNMLKNASGVPGLEVLYALLLKGLDERKLPLTHAARLLAHYPAALFRLGRAKGALAVGRDADLVLVRHDPYRYKAGASGNNFVSSGPVGARAPVNANSTGLGPPPASGRPENHVAGPIRTDCANVSLRIVQVRDVERRELEKAGAPFGIRTRSRTMSNA
jgi:hypothetical protein